MCRGYPGGYPPGSAGVPHGVPPRTLRGTPRGTPNPPKGTPRGPYPTLWGTPWGSPREGVPPADPTLCGTLPCGVPLLGVPPKGSAGPPCIILDFLEKKKKKKKKKRGDFSYLDRPKYISGISGDFGRIRGGFRAILCARSRPKTPEIARNADFGRIRALFP